MTDASRWVIHRYYSVASTMDVAARLARAGAPERSAVIADEQTAGRGRAGRIWRAPPGASLFCTVLLRPDVSPERLSTLPLLAGVAVAEAIEALTGSPVQLKWPNDVWIGADPERRKVAGILATSSLRGASVEFVLVGIGLNVSASVDTLPPAATSLFAATGQRLAVYETFLAVIQQFAGVYGAFVESGGRLSLDGWRSRAALVGVPVVVEENGRGESGIFVGVDGDGALLLDIPGTGRRRIVAGELTRGPTEMPGGSHRSDPAIRRRAATQRGGEVPTLG